MTRMHLPPPSRPRLRAWALALALAGSAAAFAAAPGSPVQYRWRDAQGNLHFSDTLSAVAIARGYEVVNAQGVVVQHVPSPAERRAEQAAAAAQAKIDAARARQQARDAQLLAAYPHESDLRLALQAQASNIEQSMRATRINLQSQESSLADLLQRAAEFEHEKKPVPPFLNNDIVRQRAAVEEQRQTLLRQQRQHAAALAAIPPQLEHYRQVKQLQDAQADSQTP